MTLNGKDVWLLWWGDGYELSEVTAVYQTQEAAEAHLAWLNRNGENKQYDIEQMTAEIWPTICAACGHEAYKHGYKETGALCSCGACPGFKDIPKREETV